MDESRHAGLKHGPVAGYAGSAHRRQGYAVVAIVEGDDLDLFRLPFGFPVETYGLEGALVRLRPSAGEIDRVEGGIGELTQTLGQTNGRDIR